MICPHRPSAVKAWCREHDFHPNRTLGQNFLIDDNILDHIVAAAALQPELAVLEVGPGLGALTGALLATGASVTAVEKDHRLADWLRRSLGQHERFTLIEGDMLEQPLDTLLATPDSTTPRFHASVSNLPYSSGTRILLDLCRHRLAPGRLIVMVQREVAERLAAAPGSAARGQAGVWVHQNYDVTLLRTVKATCFWPRPAVASILVQLQRHQRLPLTPRERDAFDHLTRHLFSQRRKQLVVALRSLLAHHGLSDESVATLLAEAGIDSASRAEDVTNEGWQRLARCYSATVAPEATP